MCRGIGRVGWWRKARCWTVFGINSSRPTSGSHRLSSYNNNDKWVTEDGTKPGISGNSGLTLPINVRCVIWSGTIPGKICSELAWPLYLAKVRCVIVGGNQANSIVLETLICLTELGMLPLGSGRQKSWPNNSLTRLGGRTPGNKGWSNCEPNSRCTNEGGKVPRF